MGPKARVGAPRVHAPQPRTTLGACVFSGKTVESAAQEWSQ